MVWFVLPVTFFWSQIAEARWKVFCIILLIAGFHHPCKRPHAGLWYCIWPQNPSWDIELPQATWSKEQVMPGIESCWSITPQITSDVGDRVDEYATINLDLKHLNSVILIHEVNYIFAFQPLYCHFISAVTRNVIYIFILYIQVNPNLVIYSDGLHAALRETCLERHW